jgi:hypothetical protein
MLQPSVSLVLAATHSFAYRDAGTEATSMEEADLQGHAKDPAAVGPWRERGVHTALPVTLPPSSPAGCQIRERGGVDALTSSSH